MEIAENQIFNLWDTNGRRRDILNAIQIYLNILKKLFAENPDEKWGNYPSSLNQYFFYKEAIKASPEIFKDHSSFDAFEEAKKSFELDFFIKKWNRKLKLSLDTNLDSNIEARARHYTSNLVRLGFTDEERCISSVGKDFIRVNIKRDEFEENLPLSDLNIVLLRQLLKLRIYTKPNKQGIRSFYSPCLMAFYLMLKNQSIDKNLFKYVVQGTSPYWSIGNSPQKILLECKRIKRYIVKHISIPDVFKSDEKIDKENFYSHIKNRKSGGIVDVYYDFYEKLRQFNHEKTRWNFGNLQKILFGKDSEKLKKAFGYGESVFDLGNKFNPYDMETFFLKNNGHEFLDEKNFNQNFYKAYYASKYIDTANEYSDTTMRLLGATGVFKFGKALPELNYRSAFQELFKEFSFETNIFGSVSNEEYESYESGLNSRFCQSFSILQILGISSNTMEISLIDKESLKMESRKEFEKHIEEKYPREKILEILRLFSNRENDAKIKSSVNEEASVPTIYEYVIALAWYYISEKKISVYDSLNLTLNGDMEPVIHAAGGSGDIIVNYENYVVMLEVTLMNISSQKRGEWEPVLRHSVNLNTENEDKHVITLFIADKLDDNTINIWRAVSSVPLQASNSTKKAEKVVISAFKNEEICSFLENGVSDMDIIDAVENSYAGIQSSFDCNWRGEMLREIQSSYAS